MQRQYFLFSQHEKKIFPAYHQGQKKMWYHIIAENMDSTAISVLGGHTESAVLLDTRWNVNSSNLVSFSCYSLKMILQEEWLKAVTPPLF